MLRGDHRCGILDLGICWNMGMSLAHRSLMVCIYLLWTNADPHLMLQLVMAGHISKIIKPSLIQISLTACCCVGIGGV
jgi:hypothetical protein